MLDALREAVGQGRPVRLLTTTYTNSTEQRALEALAEIGAEVKVSYDTSLTRLHAKAWLFHRASGYSTAYIGSSNLTFAAQQTGLEWNVRVSGARNPDVVAKMSAVFDSYWQNGDFIPYDRRSFSPARGSTSATPYVSFRTSSWSFARFRSSSSTRSTWPAPEAITATWWSRRPAPARR